MGKLTNLSELISSNIEPSHANYHELVKCFTGDPRWDALPAWCQNQDVLLLNLTSRTHRLSYFFRRVRVSQTSFEDEDTKDRLAETTTHLLLDLIPSLLELVEAAKIVDFLVPALDLCLLPKSPPSALRKLAEIIGSSDNLVQLVASNPAGSGVFCRWVALSTTANQDSETLRRWTTKLVDMVANCVTNHGTSAKVKEWSVLDSLTQQLQDLHEKVVSRASSQNRDIRRPGTVAHFDSAAPFPRLSKDLVDTLTNLQLPVPTSDRVLSNVIEHIQGEKTIEILLTVAKTLPCKLCYQHSQGSLSLGTVTTTTTGDSAIPEQDAHPHLDLLGEMIGKWKMLLSVHALKSIQTKINSGKCLLSAECFLAHANRLGRPFRSNQGQID